MAWRKLGAISWCRVLAGDNFIVFKDCSILFTIRSFSLDTQVYTSRLFVNLCDQSTLTFVLTFNTVMQCLFDLHVMVLLSDMDVMIPTNKYKNNK